MQIWHASFELLIWVFSVSFVWESLKRRSCYSCLWYSKQQKHNCWNKCFIKTLLSLASLATSNKLMGSVVDAFKTALIWCVWVAIWHFIYFFFEQNRKVVSMREEFKAEQWLYLFVCVTNPSLLSLLFYVFAWLGPSFYKWITRRRNLQGKYWWLLGEWRVSTNRNPKKFSS